MASAVDAGRIATNITSAADPWTVSLPAGIQAGDLLVVYVRAAGAQTFTLPSGWSWNLANNSSDASDDVVASIYKQADGSEGTTLSLDLSASAKGFALAWRITGAARTGTVVEANSAYFTTAANSADPPSLVPSGGTKDYLYLAVASADGESAFTAPPSPFTNLFVGNSGTAGATAINCFGGGASYSAPGSGGLNPNAFTHGAANAGGACTLIAIYPLVFATVTGQVALAGGGSLGVASSTKYTPASSPDVTIPEPDRQAITGQVIAGTALTGEIFVGDTWTVQPLELEGGPALLPVFGVVALTGTGSLTSAGVRKKIGAVALTGTSALTAYGRRGRKAAAALTGSGTLFAAPTTFNHIAGKANLTGGGSLSANPTARRDVIITEDLLVELICGPSVKTGQYNVGHIFSGDRWHHYQYDLLGNTADLTLDRDMLVETALLELLADAATLTLDRVLALGDSAALELLSDLAQWLGEPLLAAVACQEISLVDALEAQYALTSAPESGAVLTAAAATSVSLTSADESDMLLESVNCEEG